MNNHEKRNSKNHGHTRRLNSEWNPSADIYQTNKGWVIKMELAGVDLKDIDVTNSSKGLVVRGKRKDTFMEKEWTHLSMEIPYRTFKKTIELPSDANQGKAKKNYKNGMLIIKVRKADRRKL